MMKHLQGRRFVSSDEEEHLKWPYGKLRKMVSSCASRSYTNAGRSVSSPEGTTLKVDVLRCSARGLLTTDHVILNHGQVTWMTPELAPLSPNYHTTPTGKRFNSQQI
ncbi:hypothetical protein TNCV_728431 [Trichonephila clavipes]|nr:hypothetical protein TNCV_728431 [Trichonephila clavipes]